MKLKINLIQPLFFLFLILPFLFVSKLQAGENDNRWKINPAGGISWIITENIPHADHIEMSGDSISAILRYKVDENKSFQLERFLVWPMLRTIPNNTHASFIRIVSENILKNVNVNGRPLQNEQMNELILNGLMTVISEFEGISVERILFPSTEKPAFLEVYKLTNRQEKAISVEIPEINISTLSDAEKGVNGSYIVRTKSSGSGVFQLNPNETVSFELVISAQQINEKLLLLNVSNEKQKREKLIDRLWSNLVLETPDEVLNRAFAFAKIRASESIYKTAGGYMHGPGGGAYYAAIWANDQAEYVGPFFPFLGYEKGNDASLNAYLHFARFMNPEFKPIPSSIIAEGKDIWNGAGDRGDAAMIAYGAARFALTLGDKNSAEKLWPLIEWCLEYNKRKLTKNGVVASNSDELEGRFPAGDANLCTSGLYFDALISAALLGKELKKSNALIKSYQKEAEILRNNIESFFGAKVENFETYRYYEGNDVLRSWICIPLTTGIYDRAQGTIDALFSPRLWTEDGLATQAGDLTFWDRSTLYALRGVLQAGETEKAIKFLEYYSNRRLLGEHVPYPVEAYPEGGQRHLSAESGLYCRIYTEGLFGMRPTGLNSFELTPRLPENWNEMALRKINAFGKSFDIEVTRSGKKLKIVVIAENKKIFEQVVSQNSTVMMKF